MEELLLYFVGETTANPRIKKTPIYISDSKPTLFSNSTVRGDKSSCPRAIAR